MIKKFDNYITENKELDTKYKNTRKKVDSLLEEINEKLNKFDNDFDNKNWGFLGSLNHVEEMLRDINEFLG